MLEGITKHLGKDIWQNTILMFTRAGIFNLPDGFNYFSFKILRTLTMLEAIKKFSGFCFHNVVFVENIRKNENTYQTNEVCILQERLLVLPDELAWLSGIVINFI